MNSESPENSAPIVDLTGSELGDYLLLRRLGRGGMADVYLAKQGSLNRNVALKILKPELAKDESYVRRFRQEAQAAAGLMQGNIVQIYEVGECDGYYFISQEYVQGRNLRQYLFRHGAVEPVMAINVLRQSALALQEAGKHGVIHRDIKPENIMLSTKGEVKITDFGLARINNDAAQQALTQIGVTMGTPLYMSPEQVEGLDLDHRSDIYSLGVTAYHMLAGNPPFEGDNPLTIALQHVKDDPVALHSLRPDVPVELCEIIEQMMAKKKGDRPADAKSLLKELRKVKVDLDDDWEMIIEKLSVSDSLALQTPTSSWSHSKLAATRQLQAVMKGNIRSWWRSPKTIIGLVVLSIAGLVGGILAANQTAPDSILNVSDINPNDVPRKNSVREQYDYARFAASSDDRKKQEVLFQAVEKYFPVEDASPGERNQTLTVIRNAKTRLAEIYLDQNQNDKAMAIFEEFVNYEPPLGDEFRIIGHAGMAIVHDRRLTGIPVRDAATMDLIRESISKVPPFKAEDLNDKFRLGFEAVMKRFDAATIGSEAIDVGT